MEEKQLEVPQEPIYVVWNRYEEHVLGVFSTREKYEAFLLTLEPNERQWINCYPFLIDHLTS